MARNIQSLIAKNRSVRKTQLGFVEALDPLIKSSNINSILLNDISTKLDTVSDNTKSFELISSTIKALSSSMGNFVDVFNKDIEQRRTSDFFAGALVKEQQYESKFDKNTILQSTTPTKEISTKSDSGGFLGNLLKWVGGLLLAGGIGNWLWKNEDFKTKVTGFIGKLFEEIGKGAESFYTFAKDWINDEKNKEKISNFFSGLLNAIAKGFELVGDLGKVLVAEYQREGSPLRNTINTIIESIWGFVKEHPVIALGGAIAALGGSLGSLTLGLYGAAKTISLLAGSLTSPLGLLGLAAGGLGLATNWLNDNRKQEIEAPFTEEETKEYNNYIKTLNELKETHPELYKRAMEERDATREGYKSSTTLYDSPAGNQRADLMALRTTMNGTAIFGKSVGEEIKNVQNKKHAEDAARKANPPQPKLTPDWDSSKSSLLDNSHAEYLAYKEDQDFNKIDEQFKKLNDEYNKKPKQVSTQPAESTTKPEQVKGKSFSDFIAHKESGGNYNIYNTGSAKGSKVKQENFSNMTLNELMRRQNLPPGHSDRIFAAGKHQITPETMKDTVKNMGLSGEEKFTPELQERMFVEYLASSRRPDIENFIKGKSGSDLNKAEFAAGQEWAALGVTALGGKSVYEGKGTNKALVSPEHTRNALILAKQQYAAAIAAGKSEKDAYREALLGKNNLSPIENDAGTLIAKNTATPTNDISTDRFEPFSPEWLQNIVNKVTRDSPYNMSIDKLRSMPFGLINAPPKFAGSELNRASREIQTAKNKAPEVVINAPTVTNNSTSGGNNANKEVQMATIVDTEFLQILVGRTVDLFSFGANVT
jgi:hypothetical protein